MKLVGDIQLRPASILYKSIAGRYRPVRVADGPITARYIFIKNAYWVGSGEQIHFQGRQFCQTCFASLLERGLP